MKFYLGCHQPDWLGRLNVPMFVSHHRLRRYKRKLPRAIGTWALDSGAFTEVAGRGYYATLPKEYASAVRRYRDEVGGLEWAAPQDHMCESWVLAKSRIANTVRGAQEWTVQNYLTLRSIDDTLPFVPVLQGRAVGEYLEHVELYDRRGVDLTTEPLVGVGSVCRRQASQQIAELLGTLNSHGLKLHGFGVKAGGLQRYRWVLDSADSMAWSFDGRKIRPCPLRPVASCGNCMHHALVWRQRILTPVEPRPIQTVLL